MGGGATDAMLQARYGYGRGRGPRRMPVRMSTTLPYGTPPGGDSLRSEGASFGGVGDEVADDMFGVDVPDRLVNELSKYATTAQQGPLVSPATALAGQRYQRKPPVLSNFPTFGDIGDRAVAELFGADEDDEDDEDDDEGSGDEGGEKKFSLKSLPSWAIPVAAGTAAAAGAVGLGLALTSKKRKAKRAAKEEQFGAMSEAVASQMFGDPDDDEDFLEVVEEEEEDSTGKESPESAEHEQRERQSKRQAKKRFRSRFGDDPTAAVFRFGPGPSSSPDALPSQAQLSPAALPPAPPSSPGGQGSPSWRQVKRATHDTYKAQKRLDRAQQDYAAAQAKVPAYGAHVPQFGAYVAAYGSHIAKYGSYIPNFGALPHLPDSSALQRFVASLPTTASGLYDKASELILAYTGPTKALWNKNRLTTQYENFKQAVKAEGSFGSRAQSAASQGVDLVQEISGKPVSAYDRQAMIAVARAQAPLILKGLG